VSNFHVAPGELVRGTGSTTGTGDVELIAAPGAGWYLHVTAIVLSNSSATAVLVDLKENGTTVWEGIPVPAGNRGCVISLPEGGLRLGYNKAAQFASKTAVATVYCNVAGFKVQE